MTGSRRSSPNARSAFSSMQASSSDALSPRSAASAASVCITLAGSLRRPRTGCGARYGLSVSARIRSAGTRAAAARRASALRVCHVPGERHVVPPLERGVEQLGLGEAVEDDRPGERRERRGRVPARGAAVDRRPAARAPPRARDARRRARAARAACRRRGARRARSRRPRRRGRGEQLAQLVDPPRLGRRSLVRVDPERRDDTRRGRRRSRARAAGLDPRPDRHDPRHPGCPGAVEQLVRFGVARVEVRVRVDHVAGAGSSMRGKSGAAGSRPSTARVRPYATSAQSRVGG